MPIVLRSIKGKIVFLALLYCILIAFVSWSKTQTKGPHGGIIKKIQNYYIEINTPGKFIYTYLLDKKLNTISNKEVTCDVKFSLPDSTSFNLKLKPHTDGGFIGENLNGFYGCIVTFTAFGKTLSAKYENASVLAVDKK
ncbi:MAG: hypothetical protein H0W73_07160 [Bacteroidetes bacterium]|nr:hypothetical protein [Bacteroidota bacterium]